MHARQATPEWRRDMPASQTPKPFFNISERPSSTILDPPPLFGPDFSNSAGRVYWLDADADLHRVRRDRDALVPIDTANTPARACLC